MWKFIFVVFLVLAIAGFLVWMRSLVQRSQGSQEYLKKPILTDNEKEFFGRLVESLPDFHVFPQVAMGAILKPAVNRQDKRNYYRIRGTFSQKIVDYVVCDAMLNVVTLIELDDRTHLMEKDAQLNLRQKSVPFDNQYYVLTQLNLLQKLDLLVGLAAAHRSSLALFEALLEDCDMNWAELFKQYVGKNVLNLFRQDHGYKTGTYLKLWQGREDNEHLVEILGALDLTANDIHDTLYQSLKLRYEMIAITA